MRTAIPAALLWLLSACATAPGAAEADASQDLANKLEQSEAPAELVPYDVKLVFGEPERSGFSDEPRSDAESPEAERSPVKRPPGKLSGLVGFIEGYAEHYAPGRTMNENGTPVLEDSEQSLERTRTLDLWLKGRDRPWRTGETIEHDGWKLKLLSARRSAEGCEFKIQVLRERTNGNSAGD